MERNTKHPIATLTLLISLFGPVFLFFYYVVDILEKFIPEPTRMHGLLLLPIMVLAIIFVMFVGAASWLFVARHFISKEVARFFFVYPGFGILSKMSNWIFEQAFPPNKPPELTG